MKAKFIALAGNIGVGKSTLAKKFAKRFGWEPILEKVAENPYLSDFYAALSRVVPPDIPKEAQELALTSQLSFLGAKLSTQNEISMLMGEGKTIIQDRTIYEDGEIFAENLHRQGYIVGRDWETYQRLYREILNALTPPDLVIYLRASVDTLIERIKKKRARPYERDVSRQYLEQLNSLYEEWVVRFEEECPILILPADSLDFVRYAKHLDFILKNVENAVRGKTVIKFEER